MKSVQSIFTVLKNKMQPNFDGFIVLPFPGFTTHKLGVDNLGNPCILIQNKNSTSNFTHIYELEYLNIFFNKKCKVLSSSKTFTNNYTVVVFISQSIDLQSYFFDICTVLMNRLGKIPTLQQVQVEIDNIIDLFSKLNKAGLKTIQGLWGELLILKNSVYPDYLVKSWHNNLNDKFDFSDGKIRLEVKTTLKQQRIHRFSNDQFSTQPNKLYVASILVSEYYNGCSVLDLKKNIETRLKEKQNKVKLNTLIFDLLGENLEKYIDTKFDIKYSNSSLRVYDTFLLPKLDAKCVPNEMSKINFDLNLENIVDISPCNIHSKLFKFY